MLSKCIVLVGICALVLTACKKKDQKPSDDKDKGAAAAMNSMKGDGVKSDAMKAVPKAKIDATKVAERALKMQAFLSDRLFNSLPDCDKGADSANSMLDQPEWKKLTAVIKANPKAVKDAQSKLLKADRTKGAFIRKRLKVMMKCKDNAKHKALAKRLAAMWN